MRVFIWVIVSHLIIYIQWISLTSLNCLCLPACLSLFGLWKSNNQVKQRRHGHEPQEESSERYCPQKHQAKHWELCTRSASTVTLPLNITWDSLQPLHTHKAAQSGLSWCGPQRPNALTTVHARIHTHMHTRTHTHTHTHTRAHTHTHSLLRYFCSCNQQETCTCTTGGFCKSHQFLNITHST